MNFSVRQEPKEQTITFKLTPEQKRTLLENATSQQISVSAHIRRQLFLNK